MKTFKTRLVESNFEEMPYHMLHSKTNQILEKHGYQDFSHFQDNEDNEDNNNLEGDLHSFDQVHKELPGLGWKHEPLRSTSVEYDSGSGAGGVIKHEHYSHPSGAVLIHEHHSGSQYDGRTFAMNDWTMKRPERES